MATKSVNGKRVEMTPEEEAEFEADRASYTPPAPKPTPEQLIAEVYDLLETKGIMTRGERPR